jgi:hypothetical protein
MNLTLPELVNAYRKKLIIFSSVFLTVFFTLLVVNLPLLKLVEKYFDENHWIYYVWFVVFGVELLGAAVIGFRTPYIIARKMGLMCDHCNQVPPTFDLGVIVATENCPSCGKKFKSEQGG